MADPLILAAWFDAESFAHFDTMRWRHFPKRLNRIPAHLTLFHQLPGEEEAALRETLRVFASRTTPMASTVAGLRFMGKGCAYELRAPQLERLRSDLAARWADSLSRQDAHGFKPHVTIQNKVEPARAKALYAELEDGFEPFECRIEGLILQRYKGGPWEEAARYPFRDGEAH